MFTMRFNHFTSINFARDANTHQELPSDIWSCTIVASAATFCLTCSVPGTSGIIPISRIHRQQSISAQDTPNRT